MKDVVGVGVGGGVGGGVAVVEGLDVVVEFVLLLIHCWVIVVFLTSPLIILTVLKI